MLEEILMKINLRSLTPVLVGLLFVTPGALWLNAQITNEIRTHIDHSFVIGNTTLPPGEYTFRMVPNSDLSVMTATNENDKTSVAFLVREAIDDHTPNHSDLVFRRYGNTEFLDKIFEVGSKDGVAVTETSRQEASFVKQGQHAIEHHEELK
jgi:hypothetical protein